MSIPYIIPKLTNIQESCKLAEEIGAAFEYNDFFIPDVLDDPLQLDHLIQSYKNIHRDRSKDTLHGAFLDITINSSDQKIKLISRERVRQSMDIAAKLGLKAVIFHTNYLADFIQADYQKNWLDQNEDFFHEMLEEYKGISIYMENMFDKNPILLAQLSKRMNHPSFGVCFDVGHANLSNTPIDVWFKALAPYIRHLHINDNDGMHDLHDTIGKGFINWQTFHYEINRYHLKPTVLIEITNIEKQRESALYMKKLQIYPFA